MFGGNFITLLLPNTALPALVSEIRHESATSCTAAWVADQFSLERFRAKWTPVRVKKTRQKRIESFGSASIRTEALAAAELGVRG
jgi:hypothetical protein